MKSYKYYDHLQPLLRKPFFTLKDAENEGIPRHAIFYLACKGFLERVYSGIYRSLNYEPKVEFEWENLAQVASSIPEGVICLISALSFYDLTDQVMREAWIAIPHRMRVPKRPKSRIIRMRNTELGKEKIILGEYTVYIFDRERTIVDAFRYLSIEIGIKALQRYFRSTDYRPQPKKLAKYAKLLRVNINSYILSYTT